MAIDQNFAVDNMCLSTKDSELFFQDEPVVLLPTTSTMLDILVSLGIFPSKGQAKKNGWEGEKAKIPPGFSEHVIGKLKHRITILNPTEPWEK